MPKLLKKINKECEGGKNYYYEKSKIKQQTFFK